MQKLLTFFQQKYGVFNDQRFNDMLTNDRDNSCQNCLPTL